MVYLKTGNVVIDPVARLQSTFEQYAYTVELWQNDAGRKWVDDRMFSWQMLLVLLPCCTVHIYFKQKGKEPHLEKAGEPLPLSWDGWTGRPGATADQGRTSELQSDRLDTSNISGVLPIKQPAQPFPSLSFDAVPHIQYCQCRCNAHAISRPWNPNWPNPRPAGSQVKTQP